MGSLLALYRSRIFRNRLLIVFFAAVAVTTVASAAKNPTQTVIIEFSDVVEDPERPAFIEQLSEYSGVPLQYVKPLAKTRHVFSLARPIPENRLKNALNRLAKRDDIYRAEIDANKVPGKGKNAKF